MLHHETIQGSLRGTDNIVSSLLIIIQILMVIVEMRMEMEVFYETMMMSTYENDQRH
jgi:hypothetical protein